MKTIKRKQIDESRYSHIHSQKIQETGSWLYRAVLLTLSFELVRFWLLTRIKVFIVSIVVE